jgi:U32 family peptidase
VNLKTIESEQSLTDNPQTLCHAQTGIPELLAPAGNWDCARAAVENGADAIYFGLGSFNARMRADNFTEQDLPALMEFLNGRGVKGYVTFNTLIFQDELEQAEAQVRALIRAGVDAAIVQDAGLCRLIRRISPDFPIHASTQMTITSAAGVAFAQRLGCNLVVLARECSIREMEQIRTGTALQGTALPLEVFVHGALCVAYSGQCLTSEALGGRSANRGECAQACRMPYELVSDGKTVPLGDRRYLLSPQDLAGLDLLPELARAGIASLKIEGRLKTPEYVGSITRLYREALDRLSAAGHSGESPKPADPEARYTMEMAFSRGLYSGWLGGIDNQKLVHGRYGKKRGAYLGRVSSVSQEAVTIRLEIPLARGDGIVFDSGHPAEKEEGGRVYEMLANGKETLLRFAHGHIDFSRIQVGNHVWKTSDPKLDREIRRTYSGTGPNFQRPIDFRVEGEAGTTMRLLVSDPHGATVELESTPLLEPARNRPLSEESLREQLGRLGGTPFRMGTLENHLAGAVILPVSELNRLRREAIGLLEKARANPTPWQWNTPEHAPLAVAENRVTPDRTTPDPASGDQADAATAASPVALAVLVRNPAQLQAALECNVNTIYCDYENPKDYREAVKTFRSRTSGTRAVGLQSPQSIFLAPPRIFKPADEWILKMIQSAEPDGYLVRNHDDLRFFRGSRCVADFSFNLTNRLAADWFRETYGLERLTASYDLNAIQLQALLQATPPGWFEVTIHQHMPMFHMEHCVFCAFLSEGTDFRNCGRPCDTHQVSLRDRVGAEHPLKADAGCRNTVFQSRAQTGAEHLHSFVAAGARSFRIEFLNEESATVTRTIAGYRSLIEGTISGGDLWREFKLLNQLGVTRGQL